jgi:tetratricopeptide (TPR) repeat protein
MQPITQFWLSVRRFIRWLGPARSWAIFGLLAGTGFISILMNVVLADPNTTASAAANVRLFQSGLVAVFIVGTMLIILGRMPNEERRQALIYIAPGVFALALGLVFWQFFGFFLAIGLGWIVIVPIATRSRIRREYSTAVKHLRKSEYKEAIDVMTTLIEAEPEVADHYRFRAELYRLWNKLKKARNDYQRVMTLTPESGIGYNGMAEVLLQDGEYEAALPYAQKALELEPLNWIASYNLGMIEDRLQQWQSALIHLQQALDAGIPDSRHRLLAHLWAARANHALGDDEAAHAAIAKLRREKAGLNEWKTIFESEQAAVLRQVLSTDVQLAERMIDSDSLDSLA